MKRLRIGEYLVEEGIIGREELEFALDALRRRRRRRLGEILVELRIVSRERMEAVVAEQLARLAASDGLRPRPLGEHLLEEGLVDEAQLRRALAMQERFRRERLGDVLVGHGIVDRETLERAVRAQLDAMAVA